MPWLEILIGAIGLWLGYLFKHLDTRRQAAAAERQAEIAQVATVEVRKIDDGAEWRRELLGRVSELEKRVEGLNGQVDEWQKRYWEVYAQNEILKQQTAALQESSRTLSEQNAALREQNRALLEQTRVLQEQNEQLARLNAALEDENEHLHEQLGTTPRARRSAAAGEAGQ